MAQDTWNDWLENQNSGNTGIGNTGRPPGELAQTSDWGDVERQLRESGGSLFDPSDLEGIQRNTSYTNASGQSTGMSLEQALANQKNIYANRRGNTPGPSAPARQTTPLPAMQFSDPYSNLLEQLAQKQLGEVRSNPGLDQLMSFLTSQFQDLSTNPGYNPAEQAMLNTQAFEPIEANRKASMQRATERSAARGFAPSSGLHELDLRDIERSADAARTVAGRDLAIAGLDRRDRDLSRALDLGQMLGLDIPRGQRGEEIGLGNLLYQMPRTALNDALSVISGTPSSSDAFSQAIQLLQQQYNQQGRSDANNAALFGQIGSILAGLFR